MTSCNSNQTKSPRSQTSAVAIIRTISLLSWDTAFRRCRSTSKGACSDQRSHQNHLSWVIKHWHSWDIPHKWRVRAGEIIYREISSKPCLITGRVYKRESHFCLSWHKLHQHSSYPCTNPFSSIVSPQWFPSSIVFIHSTPPALRS